LFGLVEHVVAVLEHGGVDQTHDDADLDPDRHEVELVQLEPLHLLHARIHLQHDGLTLLLDRTQLDLDLVQAVLVQVHEHSLDDGQLHIQVAPDCGLLPRQLLVLHVAHLLTLRVVQKVGQLQGQFVYGLHQESVFPAVLDELS